LVPKKDPFQLSVAMERMMNTSSDEVRKMGRTFDNNGLDGRR
jgi:hypothetical protein